MGRRRVFDAATDDAASTWEFSVRERHDEIDTQRSNRCSMCRRALLMERGKKFREDEVPRETVEHVPSARCTPRRHEIEIGILRQARFSMDTEAGMLGGCNFKAWG